MDGRGTLLSISPENIVSITLMAALGFMLLALLAQFFKSGGVGGAIQNAWPASLTLTRPGA